MMAGFRVQLMFFLLSIFVSAWGISSSQPADDYYSTIDFSATDDELKTQLQVLINEHYVYNYTDVWTAFTTVDIYLQNYPCSENASYLPDVYSSFCWDPEKLEESGGECGSYKQEGDCYNREHIWPKSWFGGFDAGMNAETDLFELFPADGYVNGLRGNLPFGIVDPDTITYTSTNGCKVGTCSDETYVGTCFEPSDVYKGDFSRSYFYLATAYWNKWDCCDVDGVNASDIKPWMENILRMWHANDPVNDVERKRNDAIYSLQLNRNPFIDHPEWVSQISDF